MTGAVLSQPEMLLMHSVLFAGTADILFEQFTNKHHPN